MKPIPEAAAPTAAIRSIKVKWFRDRLMLLLPRVELSGPL
jgi:hypothetical protein